MNRVKKIVCLIVLGFSVMVGFSPAQAQSQGVDFGGARLDELTIKLGLSVSQQEQVKALLEKYSISAGGIREGLVLVQQNIRSANLGRLTDANIERLSNETGRLSAAHTESLLTTQRDFYALLTVKQKREYNKMRSAALAAQAGQLPNK
ncbi:Spy/CpxP family protein refolding chaperone [Zhongshania guokunii]|uniref:Spy/CpxP family protein refolding chaperone n=1 Tax=Zhongshania guokunii TaxID=641783 RepID=A0ABV3U1J7_9GAMM